VFFVDEASRLQKDACLIGKDNRFLKDAHFFPAKKFARVLCQNFPLRGNQAILAKTRF
jgi:hypothetical protein